MHGCSKGDFFVVLLSVALWPATGVALAQRPPARVVVVAAQMREAPSTMTLVGTVNAVRRSRVGSEIAGLVESMPCRQGDLVESGGILCTLNDDTLTHELAEAEARLKALTAHHAELLAGTRSEELARLKATVEEAAARHDRWKFEMARIEKLYEGSESNHREVYDTRAELRAADQRQAAAQAQYDEGLAGPREEVIDQAAFEAAAQKAVVDRIKSDLAKAVIRAPFTGYIVQRTTEVGEWISAGGLVVEMADLSTVLVGVDAPESCLPYLSVGDAVRVEVDALRRNFEGRIKHIIRQADENARTFPVEIELDNGSGLLAGGMFARATVLAGPKKKVVTIPKDAHVKRDGVDYVAVAVPGGRGELMGMLMAVTVGADVGDWIAIESGGVRPGTLVITRGTEGIMPFPSPIMVVDETGSPVSQPSDHGGATGRGNG